MEEDKCVSSLYYCPVRATREENDRKVIHTGAEVQSMCEALGSILKMKM
jgi:hypothetical protein